jgi:hypothetical protein
MTAIEAYKYRGYEMVPMCQWSSWCAGVYATRADLPIMTQSTLATMAGEKEEAIAEAKHRIDLLLAAETLASNRREAPNRAHQANLVRRANTELRRAEPQR